MLDWFTGPSLAIGIAVVVLIGATIAWGVLELERRSRRDEDAAGLQQALTEPLAREPALARCSVRPVVSLAWRGRARVELTGWVPSVETRAVAVRAVEREAARLGRRIRIVDGLEIVADPVRRGA